MRPKSLERPAFAALLAGAAGSCFAPVFIAGLVVAFAGTAVVVGNSVLLSVERLAGDFLGIAAAVFYGGYLLSLKYLRRTFSTATIMSWSGLSACPALLLAALQSREEL